MTGAELATTCYTPDVPKTFKVEKSPESNQWSIWDIEQRLETLRERAEASALVWYDAGMPYRRDAHKHGPFPKGAGGSLANYHAAIKHLYVELQYRKNHEWRYGVA